MTSVLAGNLIICSVSSHLSKLRDGLCELQKKGTFCDVTLRGSDGGYVKVHSLVLVCCGPVLKDALLGAAHPPGSSLPTQYTIDIPDSDQECLDAFVRYAYTGGIIVRPAKLQQVKKMLVSMNLSEAVETLQKANRARDQAIQNTLMFSSEDPMLHASSGRTPKTPPGMQTNQMPATTQTPIMLSLTKTKQTLAGGHRMPPAGYPKSVQTVREVHIHPERDLDSLKQAAADAERVQVERSSEPATRSYFDEYTDYGDDATASTLSTPEKIPQVCPFCKKKFTNPSTLNKHMRTTKDSLHPQHPCSVCQKTFGTLHALNLHEKLHKTNATVQCDICGKILKNKNTLYNHRITHGVARPFACSICGRAFKTKNYLVKHSVTHTDSKPYQCPICGRGFGQSSNVKRHMAVHSSNETEKPHSCDICGKRFRDEVTLITHRRIHTGELPHVCHVCGKGFRSIPERARHLKMHTQRLYQCERCLQSFKNLANLRRHEDLQH